MKKIGTVLLILVTLTGFLLTDAMAQPAPPKGLKIIQSCYLIIKNETNLSWAIKLNGIIIGTIDASGSFETELACPQDKLVIDLCTQGSNIKVLTKTFEASGKTKENKFIWNVSLR